MSVVGFDVGNENCVIAVVKHRGIDVLLNDESKRETPAVVYFGDKQRFLGSAGAASAAMNPKSTISQVKRLVCQKFRDPDVQEDLSRLPFATSEAADGGILIHIQYMNEERTFTPVQILGMLFSHLKLIAEKNLENSVTDCVIGIPSYFTEVQRRAYLNAAAIAGLKPLRLMHDSAATALGYGIYKTDLPSSGEAVGIVFVDIGHCDTQVSVVTFEAGQMRVLSHASDPNLGGRDFDEVLFRYFAEKFKEQYNIDVYCHARACIRLRNACEKMKKVLSANAEAPLSIECLMEEKDVKGFIRREEFEMLSSNLLQRFLVPCKKALIDAGLQMDRVQSVELVGSGSRIPAITRILSGLFRREPSRTLNASECVARGCALQCAMLSPIFRVREYEVQDSFPFSIGISSDEGPISTLTSKILFRKGQPFPSVKVLTFHRFSKLNLKAFYADENDMTVGLGPIISNFLISPFQAPQSGKTKVKVRLRLNLHGIVYVESASVIEDESNSEDTHIPDMDNFASEAAAGNYSTVRNVENGSCAPADHHDRTSNNRFSKRHEIPVSEMIYGGMTKAELLEAQEQEKQLAYQDHVMEQTKDKKNALEAYVYEVRSKLFERYRSFATEGEKDGISRSLQQTEEWLYEDGDDESEKVYAAKLNELKMLVDPIESRYKDEKARAHATRDLLNCIVEYRMAVKSVANYERDAVINECNKAEHWLREKSQQQDTLPKNADPVLWSHEIRKRTEAVDMACRNILGKSKASPPRTENDMDSDHANTPDNMQGD
ncbi:Heat shock 70 kDa protein 16 [Apostasia shenzhenica]|uniref:Heat shock 70 kDa protein 16 n=1 Tax=Apostasia shenzhenica TaxID=1088818 RepID=A0A2H9ZRN7_9ASPA|nr:Heat shock 70 kDa protein 16 [Apostasia shenzhenica]